ncbi:SLBB domain-containing protein [Thiomicrorhabdus xiamenensis]|uniref:SLBB domain-containing protein n=1 Tax=Thiomicrorhabdus xiamenensis TaxID=2739063 RepID=A0A7D4T198_9GAMM|nr:SLBB domain-containing protein [Thiomicrorhabdus xiamenensis]QKI89762.1 SLBB domain-containing protein [Thiomicrorhabdus xiamenensis]
MNIGLGKIYKKGVLPKALVIGSVLFTGLWGSAGFAVQPSAAQLEMLKSLPKSQQEALIKQYAPDLIQNSSTQMPVESNLETTAEPVIESREVEEDLSRSMQAKEAKKSIDAADLQERQVTTAIEEEVKPFGYDLFAGTPSTFAPLANAPVPADYVMGPGDTLNVQIYGAENDSYILQIDREGNIQLPNVGPLQIAGMRFNEASKMIESEITRAVIGVEVSVTAGALRSIRVFVLGDVYKPGAYVVSGLSTMSNALLSSGGIKTIGSLRNIQLKRNGKVISTLDLYDFLLKGDMSKDVSLLDGDVLFVPTLKKTVTVAGEVKRPAVYELKKERTLREIIQLAGGFTQDASPAHSKLERIREDGFREVKDVNLRAKKVLQQRIQNGDSIRVLASVDEYKDIVLVSGSVSRPGEYQWRDSLRIADLFRGQSADEFLARTDLEHVFIKREVGIERNIQVLMVNLKAALSNPKSAENISLQARDELLVLNFDDNRVEVLQPWVAELKRQANQNQLAQVVSVSGSVNYPGEYPYVQGMSIQELLSVAGGASLTSMEKALLKRENAYNRQVSVLLIGLNSEMSLKAQAMDELIVLDVNGIEEIESEKRELSKIQADNSRELVDNSEDEKSVSSDKNQVNDSHMRVQALVKRLREQSTSELPAQVVSVEGFVKFPGEYPLTEGMSAQELVELAGGFAESAYTLKGEVVSRNISQQDQQLRVENQIVSLDEQSLASLKLQSMDSLVVKRKPDWTERRVVTLSGEVKFPGTYVLKEQETLADLIQRAGGFTNQAFIRGTILQRQALLDKQNQELEKMRYQLESILAQNASKKTSMTSSEATEQLSKILQQANQAKATGRLSLVNRDENYYAAFSSVLLQDLDKVHVPEEPRTVSVIGEVFATQTFNFDGNMDASDYIQMAGGPNSLADMDRAYIVKASGRVVPLQQSGFFYASARTEIDQGDVIVIPMDVEKLQPLELWKEIATIAGQVGLALASFNAVGVF